MGGVRQCANSAVRRPASVSRLVDTGLHSTADAQRRPLSIDDVDRLAAMWAEQRTTFSSLNTNEFEIVKLPDGNYGHTVLAQDTAQVIVTMFGKILSIDPSTGMPPVYLRDADIERVGRPELFSRQIGLELATPEAVVVDALQHLREKFSREMAPACSISTDSSIPFNTSSLNVNPRVSAVLGMTSTDMKNRHWTSVTGGDPVPEKGGHPPLPTWENDIDGSKYHSFYENAAEGIYNGRKVAKSYATPLPVNVDGHADLYTHTILKVGDVCSVMCSIQGRAWKSKATGKYSGRIDFIPLRIRVHGTLNNTDNCVTQKHTSDSMNCGSPLRGSLQVKLATPVKRSTLDAGLDDILSPSSGSRKTKK
ncbi:BQ5605_C006g04274 [Microbotryum silenes-dioicae]|uniref:BQ5605_C006g04274 protein n=1 Tax=Microbotryum silenes-dioicae TaxID=796604 RepID=A0A2X0MAM7_9BASI|nr:BQ5605_C006g04274 [Microbotryum silenes-dioicae]